MPKQICKLLLIIFLHFFFAGTVLAAENQTTAAENQQDLILADCDKCHLAEIDDLNEAGLAHKTELSCSDCHPGHRPKTFDNIPRCSLCHSGSKHYQLQQCLNCHHNPHRPREIILPKKAHIECMSCHETPGVELANYQSYHSDLVCTDCHQEHGQLPACMSCHNGHTEKMAEDECQNCHQPHKPLDVTYANDISSRDCAICHADAYDQLKSSTRQHQILSCAACHQTKHKTIPACQNCHGSLHADDILAKFPECGACHGPAHTLE